MSVSSAEVGSSATTIGGAPISARAAATRCCWPTLRLRRRLVRDLGHAQPRQQPARLAVARPRPPAALGREAQRQQHIVQRGEVGQQVEHLEQDAEMRRPEPVARRPGAARRDRCPAPRSARRSGAITPQTRLSSVDLPEPDAPRSSTRSPRSSANRSTSSAKPRRPGQAKRTSARASAAGVGRSPAPPALAPPDAAVRMPCRSPMADRRARPRSWSAPWPSPGSPRPPWRWGTGRTKRR